MHNASKREARQMMTFLAKRLISTRRNSPARKEAAR